MNKLGLFIIFSCSLFISFTGQAQNTETDTIYHKKLSLQIENLNFIKNNEYFNNIADGYTLLGSYFHPKLRYQPSKNISVTIGLFGLTYAGLNKYHKVIPTFSFNYLLKDSQLTMGTLHNNEGHGLIAPLMTFESRLDERRIENGIQYIFKKKKFYLDTWLNWEHFIFKGDTQNEEFVMGISTHYQIFNDGKWSFRIPFQNLFYHRGGQINTNETQERTVFTMHHSAIGIQLSRILSSSQSINFSSFYLHYKSGRVPQEYIFESGNAFLTNIDYSYKNWKIGFGYWYGDHFVSPKGDDMYQSVSFKTDIHYEDGLLEQIYKGHTEARRSLLLGNLSYHKEIATNILLGFVLHSFFQNYTSPPILETSSDRIENQLDYSMGLYIKYLDIFNIKTYKN